ncbi:hypothetical protein ACFL29_00020 [Patescibacteria group bacterium]
MQITINLPCNQECIGVTVPVSECPITMEEIKEGKFIAVANIEDFTFRISILKTKSERFRLIFNFVVENEKQMRATIYFCEISEVIKRLAELKQIFITTTLQKRRDAKKVYQQTTKTNGKKVGGWIDPESQTMKQVNNIFNPLFNAMRDERKIGSFEDIQKKPE